MRVKFFKILQNSITLYVIFLCRLLLTVLLYAADAQAPPQVEISLRSTGAAGVKNPNEHIFQTKPATKRFDYQHLRNGNTTQQPVLFEHLSELHLTRSKYLITSYISFGEYYEGFSKLESFANDLVNEIANLTTTDIPYYIRIHSERAQEFEAIYESHKNEAMNLVSTLEKMKFQFNKILDHMEEYNSGDHREKRGVVQKVFDFLFGSSGADAATVEQIKQNLAILEDNQGAMSDELMRQLEIINGNNVQISKNRDLLNELSKDLTQLDSSIEYLSDHMKQLKFSNNFLLAMLQVRNRLDMLRDGLANLQRDLLKINEYMTSLATHKVTPNLISPYDLRNILRDVEEKLKANPKLMLPVAKEADIWSYYQFMKIEAFVEQDMLIVILVLPLIDKDLQFDLFKAHNLPLLHPEMKKLFTYDLESPYIALGRDGHYLTLPNHDDVLTCQISNGHFCNLNTPLYPTKDSKFCIYHLLVNDGEKIKENCKLEVSDYTHDSAVSLDQNIWALSVLEPIDLHVTCLSYSYQIELENNFEIVELDNACEAYNSKLILPSSNVVKHNINGSLIAERFFNYNLEYPKLQNFFLVDQFNLTKMTPEELDQVAKLLPPINKVPFRNVSALLTPINRNYPFVFPTYGYILLAVGGTTTVILVAGILYYMKYKRAKIKSPAVHYRRNKTLARLPSKDEIELRLPSMTSTNEQANSLTVNSVKTKNPVTPLLVRKTLEEEYNIDFSAYDTKRRKQHKIDSIV